MNQQRKVIHVELAEPYNGERHYYFGSVAAIYDTLPKEIVGIEKESLWNAMRSGEYRGRKATIRGGRLSTKETNRGKKGGTHE